MSNAIPSERHPSKRYFFVFLTIFGLVLGALTLSGIGLEDVRDAGSSPSMASAGNPETTTTSDGENATTR